MEDWFQAFSLEQREKLKHRLQSKKFKEFISANFELQVFAILKRLDCSVEVEPSFQETSGTVDYFVTNREEKFYVEATVCGLEQGILHSNENEQDAVGKIQAKLTNPHSDLWLSAEGELRETLGTKRVIEPFQELLRRCTAEDVRRLRLKGYRPYTEIKENGWVLEGYLDPPIATDGMGQVHGPMRGGVADASGPLHKALAKKAEDWREKNLYDEIFLIAVNVCHLEFEWKENDTMDIRRALFAVPGEEGQSGEFRDELRHVNGVIVFGNAVLGNEIGSRVRLFRNGNAKIPTCLDFLLEEMKLGHLIGIAT